jgi:hypothetical protein
MQSTEPLLQELLCDVLGHQRAGKERAQWSGKHPVSDELNAESDAKIAKACQQYEEMVQELVSVERHLLQAKARALTEEERRLGERKQALCGYDRLISLPSTGESSLGSFLDRQLLERNSLLHPAHYHPGSSPNSSHTLQPPLEEAPTYLCPTFTSNQHTATSQHSSVLKPSSTGQTKRPLRWRDQPLSPAVQEAGVRTLARLRQRGSCLSSSHHPGLSSTTEGEGSISGALRRRRATSRDPGNNDSPTRDVQLFAAEPNKVVFTDYQVGHTYQINVDIQNVSGCSRKMRLVPLNSPYFTITRGVSNHPEGLIAPGMHVTCTVTFTPPSLCNYQEEIMVQSHSGYCLTIPVLAVRPAPCLSLPEVIECGSCLAGGRMEVELEVKNSGGEGRFSVRATTHHQHHQQSPTQSEGVLILGPFTVSPTEFHLPPLHSTTLQVTFSPAAEGQYGEQFVIECNNGETISFSLTGSGDVVSVGCVSIGDSSLQEISQFTSDGSENHDADRSHQRGVDPVMSAVDDYDLYTEQLEECSVVFDVVNPRSPAYKTVVIRNYCGVDLPFCWKLFRPLTELSSSGEEDPVVDDLVPSVNSPFSVLPPSGTLPAASTHTFLCQFLPHKPGQYVDGCHLVLSHVPEASLDLSLEGETWRRMGDDDSTATCTVSPVCLFLSGVAQPYVLELEPPALLIPVAIPLATDIRRRVKLVNRSVSRLHYCWREPLPDEGITISPVSGSLVGGGGGGYCEVVIRRSVEGEFALNLICDIEHSTHPVTLSLHGWTQGPQVNVDCASLEFGLVPLGTSSQLTLTLTSHTHTSLPILLRQAIGTQATLPSTSGTSCRDSETDVTDHECIHFTPSSLTLPPHTVTTLTVECRPLVTGRLRSTLQCLVDDQVIRCLAVHAEVQSPRVVLTECVVHQDTAYVGVGCERRVQMTNTSLIPTLFSWRQQVEGESGAHCSVSISPSSGSIGPRQSLPVTITATWDSTGSHPEAILCCDVEGMSEPLLLVLSAEVHGLAVSYSVQEKCVCSSSDEEELCLEFGSEVSLFSPHTLHLLVTNTTAIPTTLSTSLSSFPPSHPHLPTPHPPPHRSRKKSLLSRTVNIGDPKSKTSQQASKDYMSDLLQEGRGCCFVVDPPTSTLLPFTTHTLTVTAYADMWGDYHDTLSCQVSGLEAVEVPIHCRVTGCPLLFHSTALPQRSLVRFGSHLVNGPPAQRVVRINNTGPQGVDITMSVYIHRRKCKITLLFPCMFDYLRSKIGEPSEPA